MENVTIKSLYYPSFYIKDFDKVVKFYTRVFGVTKTNLDRLKGWELGNTWLTLFSSDADGAFPESNPRNAEFAVQVASPEQVDILFKAMIAAGPDLAGNQKIPRCMTRCASLVSMIRWEYESISFAHFLLTRIEC